MAGGSSQHLAIFGLTVSSSWGNGHATLWRGLIRELGRMGWRVSFYEKDVPYYRDTRDQNWIEGGDLVLYGDWNDVRGRAEEEIASADVALVTSYCPDGIAASRLVCDAPSALRVFYDLDTPVTLSQLKRGAKVDYLPPQGLSDFDLVLSYTGGRALDELRTILGARATAPLYGHVDPEVHRPGTSRAEFTGDLSYIGTYAPDRQQSLEALMVEPARQRPDLRFVIAGAQYPHEFPWTGNIHFVRHLPAVDHPDFYASSRLTLNVTRADMAAFGWCPSGRLFEAAACGAVIITDLWPGLEDFFSPGRELIGATSTEDVLAALALPDGDLRDIAERGRERALSAHTSARRAAEFSAIVSGAQRQPDLPIREAS
jgi:spore maturation protein CgeB